MLSARIAPALVVLAFTVQFGRSAAPVYTLASVVNAATGVSGDLAPNGIVTIYGTDLSYGTAAAASGQSALPKTLAGVTVLLNGNTVNLFYVSPTQINFLVPSNLLAGQKTFWIFREGIAGPVLNVTLKETAPGFFPLADGSVIATHADGKLITSDSPAAFEEVIVLYAAGLGRTDPETDAGKAATRAAPILLLNQLSVLLNGTVVDRSRILYAGATPGFAGLYQINLRVPVTAVDSPEIRVFIGPQGSPPYLKLPVRLQ